MPGKVELILRPLYTAAEVIAAVKDCRRRGEPVPAAWLDHLIEIAEGRFRAKKGEHLSWHMAVKMRMKYCGESELAACAIVAEAACKSVHTVRDTVRALDGKRQ